MQPAAKTLTQDGGKSVPGSGKRILLSSWRKNEGAVEFNQILAFKNSWLPVIDFENENLKKMQSVSYVTSLVGTKPLHANAYTKQFSYSDWMIQYM